MGIVSSLIVSTTLDYLARFLQNHDVAEMLPKRAPPEAGEADFFLDWRGSGGAVPLHAPERQLARMMIALLRSRRNWIEVPDALARVEKLCRHMLCHLGLDEALTEPLARSGLVEIRYPWLAGDEQEASWSFPWEFVLAEATRTHREAYRSMPGQTFQVVRHLDPGPNGPPAPAPRAPAQLLVVTSGPGWIEGFYEFEQEQRLIVSSLAPQVSDDVLRDPTFRELSDFVQGAQPDVIHLTGVDAQQGALIRRDMSGLAKPGDAAEQYGAYFNGSPDPEIVAFSDLAPALAAHGPRLVTLNMYNSAVGAAHLVRNGAEAAIGFQDQVDDALAEQFCATVYSSWKRLSWDLAAALEEAWKSVAREPAVRGSGIVFWTRFSLLNPSSVQSDSTLAKSSPAIAAQSAPKRRRPSKPPATPAAGTSRSPTAPPSDPPTPIEESVIDPGGVRDVRSHLAVECKPLTMLNYSLLHNNQDLFVNFKIRRQGPGIYRGIRVEVRLSAGSEEAAYAKTLDLDSKEQLVELRDKIRLAITTRFGQVLAESMFGTISIKVCWGEHVLYEDTQRIELLPVDQWSFDSVNGRWLPSFIFPRDPAVRRIIEAAQRYLVVLRDDGSAGFDGYQSFDSSGPTLNERAQFVDAQVQAIWWALVNDFPLSYINPPPTFSADSQRLRSPSHVLEGRRGTCIDLALLLASCLEYIDIYPVIFLLRDHAFPGYWRSDTIYTQQLSLANLTPVPAVGTSEGGISETVPWMFGPAQFNDVLKLVREGHVVPIESTFLTSRGGFESAISEGSQNLRSRNEFESMFDIKRARPHVTPVPLWGQGS